MKFLVIVQDLRISGTSEGIVSRSFLSKLRTSYPKAIIDVFYLKNNSNDDQLHLLPVDSIETHILNLKIPLLTKWLNRLYWRIFHISLAAKHIYSIYSYYIAKIDYQKYDNIFIRSAGLYHETILGAKNLPILKKAIINFHDPYPVFWYVGSQNELTNIELFKMKEMMQVVSQAKACMSSAQTMSRDMEYLYGTKKKFYTIPHQYAEDVFDLSDVSSIFKKNKKITITYHGAIQFGRNVEILLDAYQELVKNNTIYKENTEFVLRLKGIDLEKLAAKYCETENIVILNTLNFSNSANEQLHIADINIIIENGPTYCNILVGKAPFLASLNKPILVISPSRSEIRGLIKDSQFIADCNDKEEIKQKLDNLIKQRLKTTAPVYPFGDYFSDEKFKSSLEELFSQKNI